jgi:hypothetical protein
VLLVMGNSLHATWESNVKYPSKARWRAIHAP